MKQITERWRKQKVWIRSAHRALVQQLGGVCVEIGCGERNPDKLEIDHKHGTTVPLATLSWSARISRYRREAREGLVQVKCRHHNTIYRPTKKQIVEEQRYTEWLERKQRLRSQGIAIA